MVTLTSGIPDAGTEPLVPGLFRRNGELLGATFLLFVSVLPTSLFILEKKSQHFAFAHGGDKRSLAPWESRHAHVLMDSNDFSDSAGVVAGWWGHRWKLGLEKRGGLFSPASQRTACFWI